MVRCDEIVMCLMVIIAELGVLCYLVQAASVINFSDICSVFLTISDHVLGHDDQ